MKAYHTLVVGDSGTGKTTLLRELHDEFRGVSIWVNHNGETGVRGVVAASERGMRQAVGEYRQWDAVRINMRTERSPTAAFAEARAFAHSVYQTVGVPVQIVLDEAHAALPDSDELSGPGSGNPVRAALHEDRDKGVKVVLGTQDPSDLYYPPIKQVRHIAWVGPPSSFHEGFVRYYKLKDIEWPTERFEYVVIKPSMPPEVVYRARTNQKYA